MKHTHTRVRARTHTRAKQAVEGHVLLIEGRVAHAADRHLKVPNDLLKAQRTGVEHRRWCVAVAVAVIVAMPFVG